MNTPFKKLPPSEAWGEAERRSAAIGIAGWLVVGALQAIGTIPTIYRLSLAPASGLEAAFLTALTLSLAYYHNRWWLGVCGAALTLCLPYPVNLLWIRLSDRSLLYPMVVGVLLGVVSLWTVHSRVSGPMPEDAEEAILRKIIEESESNLTWSDRVTWLCITVSVVILLVLLLR